MTVMTDGLRMALHIDKHTRTQINSTTYLMFQIYFEYFRWQLLFKWQFKCCDILLFSCWLIFPNLIQFSCDAKLCNSLELPLISLHLFPRSHTFLWIFFNSLEQSSSRLSEGLTKFFFWHWLHLAAYWTKGSQRREMIEKACLKALRLWSYQKLTLKLIRISRFVSYSVFPSMFNKSLHPFPIFQIRYKEIRGGLRLLHRTAAVKTRTKLCIYKL